MCIFQMANVKKRPLPTYCVVCERAGGVTRGVEKKKKKRFQIPLTRRGNEKLLEAPEFKVMRRKKQTIKGEQRNR